MSVLLNIVLPIIAGIFILVMFVFIWRAFTSRSKASHQAYNVGRQEALKKSRVNLVRAVFALFLALILIGAIGISPNLSSIFPNPTATPNIESPEPTLVVTVIPTFTPVPTIFDPSPTAPLPTATNTPVPTNTSTPAPLKATVSSGVGVWLRTNPGVDTDQLEWLLDGTELIVLDGRQTIEDLEWRQVQTDNGVTGWVAAEFIVINEPQQ